MHRLTVEKTCGCQATREYEDARYQKPMADGAFTPCDKHRAAKAVVEFAGEMMLESLDKEAETLGKAPAPAPGPARHVVDGDNAGVQAQGESVQAMGMTMPRTRERRDPLAVTTRTRPAPERSHAPALTTAAADDDAGITITGDIDAAPEDPRLSSLVEDALMGDPALDAMDMKDAGVPQRALQDGK